MNIVFLGSGIGSGHVIHAASLFFAVKRAGIAVQFTLVSDSEYCHLVESFFEVVKINMQPQFFLKKDRETELYLLLRHLDVDILIVYGLWLPLLPILDDFSFKKIILFRQYEDWWFHLSTKEFGNFTFNPDQYDLSVSAEPNFLHKGWISVNPFIIRNKDEIFNRDHARRELGAQDGRKICILAHNGLEGELEAIESQMNDFRQEYQVIKTTNRNPKCFFPLADYFNGIDLLIGGAGYHLFYESRFFDINARFFPQKRKNEDQSWRIKTNSNFTFTKNGADELAEIMRNL